MSEEFNNVFIKTDETKQNLENLYKSAHELTKLIGDLKKELRETVVYKKIEETKDDYSVVLGKISDMLQYTGDIKAITKGVVETMNKTEKEKIQFLKVVEKDKHKKEKIKHSNEKKEKKNLERLERKKKYHEKTNIVQSTTS